MILYKTSIEDFNKKIVYYLEEIKGEEMRRENKYNFVNSVKLGGIIHCFTTEEKIFKEVIFMNLVSCSKTIEDKLLELTNY